MMPAFRIEPEFQNKIPPISEDEFNQLRENILEAGEVYEPLVIWNGIMIDGHNRWKVIQENPSIKYKVREIPFPDKWAAFEWMYKNQLGRRNLTDEQRMYTIGKMYEVRKKSQGEHKGNQYTKLELAQNEQIPTRREHRDGTAGNIANDIGVGRETVKRAEKFAKGVDALRVVSPEAADKVLSGKANVANKDVQEIAKMEPEKVIEAADAIITGKRLESSSPKQINRAIGKSNGQSAESRKLQEMIAKAYAPMLDTSAPSTYNIDDLCEEIEANGKTYTQQLRRTIDNRRNLLNDDEARKAVKNAVNHILQDISKELHRI